MAKKKLLLRTDYSELKKKKVLSVRVNQVKLDAFQKTVDAAKEYGISISLADIIEQCFDEVFEEYEDKFGINYYKESVIEINTKIDQLSDKAYDESYKVNEWRNDVFYQQYMDEEHKKQQEEMEKDFENYWADVKAGKIKHKPLTKEEQDKLEKRIHEFSKRLDIEDKNKEK